METHEGSEAAHPDLTVKLQQACQSMQLDALCLLQRLTLLIVVALINDVTVTVNSFERTVCSRV